MAETVLIITGAGASVNLNADPGHPIAQMSQWARALTDELDRTLVGFAQAIHLNPGMDGEQFERALGEFLAWSRALPVARSLRGAGYEALGMAQDDKIDTYFQTATSRAKQATEAIHRVLFNLFGRNQFNQISARNAYGGLLQRLNVSREDQVFLATTNYDGSLELAFEELGYGTVTGESVSPATGQRHLRLDQVLSDGRPDRVPILHLHGRVGWYLTEDGALVATDWMSAFNETFGQPALLLPDPQKDYSLFAFTQTIWDQLDQAISRAAKILVLGHSLNDQALIRALNRAPRPGAVGVSIWPNPDIPARQRDLQRLIGLMPKAHILPIDFRPDPTFHDEAMTRWITGSDDPADLSSFANPS